MFTAVKILRLSNATIHLLGNTTASDTILNAVCSTQYMYTIFRIISKTVALTDITCAYL